MDKYKIAWDNLKWMVQDAIREGQSCGYDVEDSEYFPKFEVYEYIQGFIDNQERRMSNDR